MPVQPAIQDDDIKEFEQVQERVLPVKSIIKTGKYVLYLEAWKS